MRRHADDRGGAAARSRPVHLVALVCVSTVAGYAFASVVHARVLSQGCRDVVGSSVCAAPSVLGLTVVAAVASFAVLLAIRSSTSRRSGGRRRRPRSG